MLRLEESRYLNPYIIAEIGVNHGCDMNLAKKMIEEVARAGGHAAKFQSYKADKIAAKNTSPYYWDINEEPSTSQHSLFQKFDKFGEREYKELADHCIKCGIDFMSTPFDLDAVDYLDELVPYFKIASADITNIPLLRKVAKTGKPIIVSTGASKLGEVDRALEVLNDAGAKDISLLHCVLNYPTPKENAQMALMDKLKRIYGDQCSIGYSDHVKPDDNGDMPVLEMATLKGATIIEKHYTYDKTLKGNDHYHAMDESDLSKFCEKIKSYNLLFGNEQRDLDLESKAIANARRRIIVNESVSSGTKITEEMLVALRSCEGIEISFWDDVIGKKLSRNVEKEAPLNWSDLD